MNIKDTVVKNIFLNTNEDEQLKKLYTEIIKEELILNKDVGYKKVGKSVLADYMNAHPNSFIFKVVSEDGLEEEKPTEEPKEEILKLESVSIKGDSDVLYLGYQDQLEVEVLPRTKYSLEFETDGSIIKIGRDGKTIYPLRTGKGWVIVKAINELGLVESEKKIINVYHEPLISSGLSFKVNGEDRESIEAQDYLGMSYTIPSVDFQQENKIDIFFNVDSLGGEKRVRDMYGLVNLTMSDGMSGDLSNGVKISQTTDISKVKDSLSLRENRNIKLGYTSDIKDDSEILFEKAPNILSNTDKDDFTVENWTKGNSSKIIRKDNGLAIVGNKLEIENKLSKPIKLSGDDLSGTGNFLLTAKGLGSITMYLKSSDTDEKMDEEDSFPVIYVDSSDEKEYSVEFSINRYEYIYEDTLDTCVIIVDGEVEIMDDSLKVETSFFGMNDTYVSPKTKAYKNVGILYGSDKNSKYDYVWYDDDSIDSIVDNTYYIELVKTEPYLTGEFGSRIFDTNSFSINEEVLVALNVLGKEKSLHKVPLSELKDIQFIGAKVEKDIENSTITPLERGLLTIKGSYVSPFNTDYTIEYNNTFIIEQTPEIPMAYVVKSTDYDNDYIVHRLGGEDYNNTLRLLEDTDKEYKIYGEFIEFNLNGSTETEKDLSKLDKFKISTVGNSLNYENGILSYQYEKRDDSSELIIEFSNPYKYINLYNPKTQEFKKVESYQDLVDENRKDETPYEYVTYGETDTKDLSNLYIATLYSIVRNDLGLLINNSRFKVITNNGGD